MGAETRRETGAQVGAVARSAPGAGSSTPLFVRATIYRPIGLLMLFVALLVVGVIAYPRIPLQLVPPGMTMGACGIHIPVPDGTPAEVMDKIAKPCEDYLRTIPGIRKIISSSSASRCRLHIEFDPNMEVGVLVAELRDRLERAKPSWPEGVDRYFVWRHSDSEMPIYIAALSTDVDENKVDIDALFEDVIQKRLEAVDGVARVNVWGLVAKEVEVALDPDRVEAHAVPLPQLIQRLQGDNRTLSAGSIRDGDRELFVVVDGRFRTFDEVMEYPAGAGFRIEDFAEVGYAQSYRDQISRVNGNLARVIVVNKESSANTVDVCARIDEAVAALEEELVRTVPTLTQVDVHAWLNQGEMIRFSVQSLEETALCGGLFAVIVLFVFFRRIGMTVLVTLSIPFSLLIAVIWIFFRGGSFNLMSLMGLSLGIGMLVDNSIVVVENILRQRELGFGRRPAAIAGVLEVGLAVTLATLTTMMVFLPILLITDPRFKVIAREIGEPVCVSVLASLLVALVFIPQGTIQLQRRRRRKVAAPARFSRVNRLFGRGVVWCLGHRVEVLFGVLALFGLVQIAFQHLPKKAVDAEGGRRLQVNVELPPNTTLREANDTFSIVEDVILARKEEWRLASVTSWFGPTGGEINVFLEPGTRTSEEEFFALLRPLLPRLAGVEYRLGFDDFGRDEGGPRVRVFVRGNDLERLAEIGARVRADLEDPALFPELTEIDEWEEEERAEIRVEVNRSLAQAQALDTRTISRTVAWALRGAQLPDFAMPDDEHPFWVAYAGGTKTNAEEIDTIQLWSPGGRRATVGQVANRRFHPSQGEIHRVNGKMTVGYSAGFTGKFDPMVERQVREKIERHFGRFSLPDGYEITTRQEAGGFEADFRNAIIAVTMAFLLVFFLMGMLFESFILPLSVLCAVPFAFSGSVLLIWASGVPLDVVGMIGMLMLVGIVVNNAIVLVDYINRLRRSVADRETAIRQAVQIRFRPIWMTALTTIFGLLPLIVIPQRGEGIDYQPLATVLVGGLLSSTFFTLFLVPVLYTVLDDVRRRWLVLVSPAGRSLRVCLGDADPPVVPDVESKA